MHSSVGTAWAACVLACGASGVAAFSAAPSALRLSLTPRSASVRRPTRFPRGGARALRAHLGARPCGARPQCPWAPRRQVYAMPCSSNLTPACPPLLFRPRLPTRGPQQPSCGQRRAQRRAADAAGRCAAVKVKGWVGGVLIGLQAIVFEFRETA